MSDLDMDDDFQESMYFGFNLGVELITRGRKFI
jgi:hypothetical protein